MEVNDFRPQIASHILISEPNHFPMYYVRFNDFACNQLTSNDLAH